MLGKLFGHKVVPPGPDPALKKVKERLDATERRLTLIELEIKVIKGDVTK